MAVSLALHVGLGVAALSLGRGTSGVAVQWDRSAGGEPSLALVAAWSPAPVDVIEAGVSSPPVWVMPSEVHVGPRHYRQSRSSAEPAEAERAAVERLLATALPAAASSQKTLAVPRASLPPPRRALAPVEVADVEATLPPRRIRRGDELIDGTAELTSAAATAGAGGDQPPRLLSNRPPSYPPEALAAGQEGVVLLRLRIAADGTVADLEVVESSGYPALDAAAGQAIARWRFAPATRAGVPVAATVRLPVRFALDAAGGGGRG